MYESVKILSTKQLQVLTASVLSHLRSYSARLGIPAAKAAATAVLKLIQHQGQ